ncbi:MAG: PASTA domain-containing protein [Candidatus Latescibacterota bacterium]|nr:PASTA domain-containing protein [Candidatus Latescibacterota bacterium]
MRRLLRNLAIFAAVVVGTLALFLLLLDYVIMPYIVDVKRVTVPDVREKTLSQAAERLQRRGLRLAIGDSVHHETLGKGYVVDQTPAPRRRIKKGRRVFVHVSLGRRLYAVPDVSGGSRRDAQLKIAGSQLALGRIEYVSSGSIPEGAVISQRPAAGTRVRRQSRVNLVISSGSPFAPKRVPDLVGISIEAVEDSLRNYEMQLGQIRDRIDNSVPEGQVLFQDPGPESRQLPNTAINVVVSVRSTTTPTPPDSTSRRP